MLEPGSHYKQLELTQFSLGSLVVMFPVETGPFLVIMRLSGFNIQGAITVVHEISQFDIPDRQLLASKAQPRSDMRMDIGEAKITRTIFGRAKVRVIREQDRKRRAWLLTVLALMAIAAAVWQGWISFQQMQSAAPPLSLNERIRVSPPAFQPEAIPEPPPSVRDRQRTQTQIVIDSMTTRREPAPKPPLGLKSSGQLAEKSVTGEPLAAKPLTAKPQTAPLAANNSSAKNQADLQAPPKPSAPPQLSAPAAAALPATQSPANKAAAVAPPAEPLARETTAPPSSAGDNQPPEPVKAQPSVNSQP